MPRALDSQQLTITHSPTQRIDFNNAKQGLPAFDPVALVTQWTQFLEDYGFQIISDITGIDLTTLQTILGPLIDGLELVTEALNALTSGDPTEWLAFFTDLGSFNLLTLLNGFGGGSSILNQIIGLIPGIGGGLTGLGGLGSIFDDLFGLLGSPTSVGTGTPSLPGIGSIPILGGLLSGGNLLTSIIPGLDASKIITGLFSQSQVANLSTMLGGFGTGSSIIAQLLGLIPNLAGSTTGLGGLGDVFTDLFGLLGSPTNVGSTGTLTLPGISSIPILGGLLSGGNILTSIIPGLDASKIITGSFGISQITNLGTMLGGLGTGSSIINQILAAVPNLASGTTGLTGLGDVFADLFGALGSPTNVGSSGTFTLPGISSIPILGGLLSGGTLLTSIIPGLDASKIITGSFAQSFITGLPSALSTLTGNTQSIIDNFVNGWTGGSSTGNAPSAVTSVAGQIRTAVLAGYTVDVFTTSNAAWTIPSGTIEMLGCVVNGGNRGTAGATSTTVADGGSGGLDGGYLSAPLDLTGLTAGTSTLNVAVGAAAASPGGSGGVSSVTATTGTLITGSAGANGISSTQGLVGTTSQPGKGGDGGSADATTTTSVANAGIAGGSSGLGGAGAGGTARTANSSGTAGTGGNGGAGQTSGLPIVGGGGGGGGGGGCIQGAFNIVGGAGGNGGFPGGGSGGGGAAAKHGAFGTATGGAPGTPGNGIVVLIHK